MKFRADSVKFLCTTAVGVAGIFLVALCALCTVASVDFGVHSNGLQGSSLEWLLGSDQPSGMILPHHENPPTKPATPNPPSPLPGNAPRIKVSRAAELNFEEDIELTETQPSASEAPVSLDPGDGSIRWSFDVCLVVRVGSEGRSVLPYGELYRLFNAARSVGLKKTMWVGTDATTIVCKMARDALHPDVQCSKSDGGGVHKTKKKCKHLVVGETKQYAPQPSPDELQTFNVHYESIKVVDLDAEDPARTLPSFPESAWRPTIVTAFSSNHVEVGLLLLRSLGRVAELQSEFNVSVVVWTMKEFPAVAAAALNCVVEELQALHGVPTEVREFDFDAWPQWMRINQKLGYNGGRGEYAWKAVMVHTVLLERGFVYWADAGDRFRTVDGLTHTFRSLKLKGFASRRSSGQVKQWCHPRQLEYFRANVERIRHLPNCDASGIGFTLQKYSELARPWYECSITRQCIAPDGSSRRNHRQDQSALTVLAALTGNHCEGVHQGIHRNLDSKPQSYMMGVEATKCYKDPLRVKFKHTGLTLKVKFEVNSIQSFQYVRVLDNDDRRNYATNFFAPTPAFFDEDRVTPAGNELSKTHQQCVSNHVCEMGEFA